MKNKTFTLEDFASEKLNKEAQKVVRGGDGDPPVINNPIKNGGGGNG